MASLVTDPDDLPPDMILLPSGQEMRLDQFWAKHGNDLRPFANAKIAVATPSLHIPNNAQRALTASVGLAIGLVVQIITRNAKLSSAIGTVATAYAAPDIASWIKHHLEHRRIVRVYTIAELFPGIENSSQAR